jgi:hypothetical protein
VSPAHAIVLAVGAVVLLLALPRAVPGQARLRPHRRRPRLRAARRRGSSPDLAALDRLLNLSTASAEDVHVRLRPLVTEIARQRLADHTGVRLDADPESARALLGEETWELVRPDRPRPADRRGRGLSAEWLHAVVTSLERIGAPG